MNSKLITYYCILSMCVANNSCLFALTLNDSLYISLLNLFGLCWFSLDVYLTLKTQTNNQNILNHFHYSFQTIVIVSIICGLYLYTYPFVALSVILTTVIGTIFYFLSGLRSVKQ